MKVLSVLLTSSLDDFAGPEQLLTTKYFTNSLLCGTEYGSSSTSAYCLVFYIRQHGSAVYVGMVVVVCIP